MTGPAITVRTLPPEVEVWCRRINGEPLVVIRNGLHEVMIPADEAARLARLVLHVAAESHQ